MVLGPAIRSVTNGYAWLIVRFVTREGGLRVKKRVLLFVAALALGLAVTAIAFAGGTTRGAKLLGQNEVPGPGDPNGKGWAAITLNATKGTVCWKIAAWDLSSTPTAAHIHEGTAAEAGPVVVTLSPPVGGDSAGCTTASSSLVKDIARNSGGYYVNVHTTEFPAGAIRGQLGTIGSANFN
jgi:hypothetical protein